MLIQVKIEGSSPLLMNRFTEAAQQSVSATSRSAHNGSKGTPREQAEPKLYASSKGKPVLPGPNLLAAIVEAGKFIKSGKSKLTTNRSSLVPAGINVAEIEAPVAPTKWEVDSRPVVIPATGGRVMCHRPRFDAWACRFTLEIDEELFDEATARQLVDLAGHRIGIGDFRPARRGPFGRFSVVEWKKK